MRIKDINSFHIYSCVAESAAREVVGSMKGLITKLFGKKKEPGPAVAEALAGLTEEYMVFSSMIYNNSEIGHVVFSRRQGLFVINAIKDKGEISYNGTHLLINRKPKSDPIKKALKDTFWLKATIKERTGLDVHITPLVVSENAWVKVEGPIIGVNVLESDRLVETITQAPGRKVLEDGVVMILRELHGTHTISYRGN